MFQNPIVGGHGVFDNAWTILEAANDLRDAAAVETCRRVIDAGLAGREPVASDVKFIVEFFD
jgi:hypothetical protein